MLNGLHEEMVAAQNVVTGKGERWWNIGLKKDDCVQLACGGVFARKINVTEGSCKYYKFAWVFLCDKTYDEYTLATAGRKTNY